MRDVDLFMGVDSVGNDPNWRDGGVGPRYHEQWQSAAFDTLFLTAKTRKEVLQNIIPKLEIGSRCDFSDRFLIVRGDIRTYKIHFGSGNILMAPNDHYLCIVPNKSAGNRARQGVFLPFEGDQTLAIILSKALLLAAENTITDPTVLRQIRPL